MEYFCSDPRLQCRIGYNPSSVSMSRKMYDENMFWKDCAVRFLEGFGPKNYVELDPRLDENKNASGIAGKREEVRKFYESLKTKKSPQAAAAAFIKTAADDSSHNEESSVVGGMIDPSSTKAFARPSKVFRRNLFAVDSS